MHYKRLPIVSILYNQESHLLTHLLHVGVIESNIPELDLLFSSSPPAGTWLTDPATILGDPIVVDFVCGDAATCLLGPSTTSNGLEAQVPIGIQLLNYLKSDIV